MVVREQGVMMAVGDLQSVQEVTTKIGKLVNFIDGAKGKNVKVQPLSEELGHDLIDIRDLIKNYQGELRSAISGAGYTKSLNAQ